MLSAPEYLRFNLDSLREPMIDALSSAPFTHLRIESCSMWSDDFADVLKSLAGTLQVIELIDVASWGDQDPAHNLEPILQCLRLRLQTLVLDDVRVTNKDYDDPPGILWHGQQQIHAGLDVLAGFDDNGWDYDDLDDSYEDRIRAVEERTSSEYYFQTYFPDGSHAGYSAYKGEEERSLEGSEREYAEYKASRASAKEATARVEAGDISS
ncbi:unnamed protein product [Aureobasidium vineae]|uniref:Uncharacterized protein n=1 Tax=Aureobasidium vineae TaxID=2773715 RepID=A0A9N8JKQ1_9PEZI|nr:unnamed protein product [Aureobasidium vineae]